MIVGTAGHIDHGKTALVRALTGIDTDRLPAEKARGISIDLGFAYRRVTEAETLGFVDVPGHEGFIHNMLAGAAGIDFLLLVVAADDGPMPQTREHLQIVDLLGIGHGIVALSKCDLVDAERIAEVRSNLRDLLARTSLAGVEIVPVSVVTGEGLSVLEARLLDALRLPPRPRGGRFRLAVDRSFSLPGAGTIVTGTVFAGAIRVGERLTISPSGLDARVRAIHAQNTPAERGNAGQRCALNLVGSGVDRDHIHRGDWVVDQALHAPTERFDARVRLLPSEDRPLRQGTPVHLHLGADRALARIAPLDRDQLMPGDDGLARIALDHPIGALHGDRFVFRDHSARRTMGGGIVIDPWPPQRGRKHPQRLSILASLGEPDPRQALSRLVAGNPGWVDLTRFALARNLTSAAAAELWETCELVRVGAGDASFGFGPRKWPSLVRRVQRALGAHHQAAPNTPGLEPNRLRVALGPLLPADVFVSAIGVMVREGLIQRDGPWLKLAGHSVRLTPGDERLWGRICPVMERAKFQPPRVRDFAQLLTTREDEVRQLMRRLARMGRLVEIAHDHFYDRAAVAELTQVAQLLTREARDGKFTAAAFRDRIGTGRKLAIQILEFLDRTGITLREGDLRSARKDSPKTGDSLGGGD